MSYTFSSSEAGEIKTGGSGNCVLNGDFAAIAGNNTISLLVPGDGDYDGCEVRVEDAAGNEGTLAISAFTVDSVQPWLEEISPIDELTTHSTSDYTFSSDEAGALSIEGGCTTDVTDATTGSNTISVSVPADGAYADCTLSVTDLAGNTGTLNLTPFTVDTSGPSLLSSSPADNETSVDVSVNAKSIYLYFDETIYRGDGNVSVSTGSGTAGDHAIFHVLAAPNLSFEGDLLAIRFGDPFDYTTTYSVQIEPGALVDALGNPFAGIADATTVNFTTETVPVFIEDHVTPNEAAGDATVSVTLANATSDTITVDYATADGTATAGADYTSVSGTLTFAAGSSTASIAIPILGDTVDEDDETVTITLSNPHNATLGSSTATLTIVDDEGPIFTAQTFPSTSLSTRDVHVADVNGDDYLDIVFSNFGFHDLVWHRNDGDPLSPGFTQQTVNSGTDATDDAGFPVDIDVADMDGDGDLDVVSAFHISNVDVSDVIVWYENDGELDASYTVHEVDVGTYNNIYGDAWLSIDAGDLDGDGDQDIAAVSEWSDSIAWYENDGENSPTFAAADLATDIDSPQDLTLVDLNEDGHLDVIALSFYGNKVYWYENDGNASPSFTEHLLATNVWRGADVEVADINGDGHLDMVVASDSSGNQLYWLQNQGLDYPTFTVHEIDLEHGRAIDVHIADIDGDGDQDIALASYYGDSISWLSNQGGIEPTFKAHIIDADSNNVEGVFIADIDDDGDLDIVAGGNEDDEVISWYQQSYAENP